MFSWKKIKFLLLQIFAAILYIDMLQVSSFAIKEDEPQLAWLNFVIQVVIMIAIAMLLAPKPKSLRAKPLGLEEFDIPTAEEGRSIQVLFGKKYVASPNVVWFGHLKSQAVKK